MSHHESKCLLSVFPNEVWTTIFGNVRTSKMYYKISDASSFFDSFLKPRRVEIFFPEVANLLPKEKDAQPFAFFTPLQPAHPSYLPKCRKVCRAWKAGVDQVLQNPAYFYQFPSGSTWTSKLEQNIFQKEPYTKLKSLAEIAEFKQHFEDSHSETDANPFGSRAVGFLIIENQDKDVYFQEWKQFLQQYGHHIWYCYILFVVENPGAFDPVAEARFYINLCKVLPMMPNLRAFEFSGTTVGKISIGAINFPSLPQLHFLHLVRMPLNLVHGVLINNSQVRIVDARGADNQILKMCMEELPNLKRLGIQIKDDKTLQTISEAKAKCSIESLCLEASRHSSWDEMLSTVRTSFSKTVTEIFLELPYMHPSMPRTVALVLSKLKILNLKMVNPEPLDFLFPLTTTLEELSVRVVNGETTQEFQEMINKEDVFKLFAYWKTPQKSNVWHYFPKLRVLKTQCRSTEYSCIKMDRKDFQGKKD